MKVYLIFWPYDLCCFTTTFIPHFIHLSFIVSPQVHCRCGHPTERSHLFCIANFKGYRKHPGIQNKPPRSIFKYRKIIFEFYFLHNKLNKLALFLKFWSKGIGSPLTSSKWHRNCNGEIQGKWSFTWPAVLYMSQLCETSLDISEVK